MGNDAADLDGYDSVASIEAAELLELHYDIGGGLYKMWASPGSVLAAAVLGWARCDHPAQLHYGWDLAGAASLDDAIRDTTRRAFDLLDIGEISAPLVFEPGCGIGGAATDIALLRPDSEVIGLSAVRAQVETARRCAAAMGIRNATFCHGNYLGTPFDDGSFDGIYAIESLCYTPANERPALVAELYRLLRPGSRIVVMDGCTCRAPENEEERRYVSDVLAGWTFPAPCTPGEFLELADQAGFEMVEQRDVTSSIYDSARRIAAIARYLLLPLTHLASLPGVGRLLSSLGFGSSAHARRFVAACLSQLSVFDLGRGACLLPARLPQTTSCVSWKMPRRKNTA
ncbi:class I SAM-dependent methyltransferase [Thauera butanivorans]|uniref:class I SAM-dependent methyltransferase n=1 Tax=Thauera butanivorans TaxID=86174 RepID=UPI000838539E|nr:class I SAM-dependent methyltransferase [Thauera butanivorans]